MLHPENLAASPYSADTLLNDNIILDLARDVVPEGIHVEIPMRVKMSPMPGKHTEHVPLLVYLMVYGGERVPLTRKQADGIRSQLEERIRSLLGFELAKAGRLVSKPFPYPVLEQLIRDYS
jgi:hypothetical protein